MPTDQTIDFVVLFLTIGMLLLALGSMLLGWLVRTWDRLVNRYQIVMSSEEREAARTERTNERTNERSSHQIEWDTFLLDRTRARLIEVMVDSDLTTTEIRTLLKGEAKAIGEEVETARARLGKPVSAPYRTPVAGRPVDPRLFQTDPELVYQPPD